MAKKFVRGITDIKTISNQDFDTNNVNDLLSDGQHNYIHRKKGNSEEYHNLTNNLKTIQSDDTDLISVTNYNNTTNSATIRPKHDSQKEQVLESTDNTIVITHGKNGTDETTSVDVNPEKVLTHDNLKTGYGISKTTSGNTTTLGVDYTLVNDGFDLNNLKKGKVRCSNFVNAPQRNTPPRKTLYFVSAYQAGNDVIQEATTLYTYTNDKYVRACINGVWSQWREQVGDKSVIDGLLAQKQNTLTSNTSIGLNGSGLRQLYTQSQTYTHANGTLKTHVKSIANSSSVSTLDEEFNFLAKMNKSQTSADFTLNAHDKAVFEYLIETYGVDNKINVCGAAFTLNGSSLNFNTNGAQYNPHIITFSDIVPTSAINVKKGDSVTVDKVDEIVEKVDSKQSE